MEEKLEDTGWKADQYYDFSGALNRKVGRESNADNEVTYVENGTIDKVGNISKRMGYTQKGLTEVTTTTSTSSSTSTSTSTSTTA